MPERCARTYVTTAIHWIVHWIKLQK